MTDYPKYHSEELRPNYRPALPCCGTCKHVAWMHTGPACVQGASLPNGEWYHSEREVDPAYLCDKYEARPEQKGYEHATYKVTRPNTD